MPGVRRAAAVAMLTVLAVPAVACALPELAISPAVLELAVGPGQAVTREITVSNPGTVGYRVTVYAWDMWHDGRQRRYGPPGTFPRSVAQGVTAVPGGFELAPGQRQVVQVTVDVPADARGGRYGVVFFEMAPAGETVGRQGPMLAIAGRIGASVIVDTGVGGQAGGRVEQVVVEEPTASAPLRVRAEVANETETHLRPYGAAVILKEKAAVGRFTLPSVLLLPGQKGQLEGEWSGTLAPGSYAMLLTIVSSDGHGETLERRFSVR